jgi:hypothetical protein
LGKGVHPRGFFGGRGVNGQVGFGFGEGKILKGHILTLQDGFFVADIIKRGFKILKGLQRRHITLCYVSANGHDV